MPEPVIYEIRVVGHLGDAWSVWFEGLSVETSAGGETTLRGPVADQAALHGILMKIRDLGMTLIYVQRVDEDSPTSKA